VFLLVYVFIVPRQQRIQIRTLAIKPFHPMLYIYWGPFDCTILYKMYGPFLSQARNVPVDSNGFGQSHQLLSHTCNEFTGDFNPKKKKEVKHRIVKFKR
jgi:hypothetical protein